jgi:Cys-rich repeat protein
LQRTLCCLATLAVVAGCDDFQFAGSVVGGDASTDDVATLDLGDLDIADGLDVASPDADVAPDVTDEGCRASASCTDPAAPVCDLATGRCVACTTDDDRCPRGRYCNAVTRSCTDGCRNDDDCALPVSGDAGAGPRRFCDVGRRVCVQCRRDAECPSGQFCAGGVCEASCSPTIPCPAGRTCCGGACVDPLTNRAHCGACGVSCALANAAPACRDGRCAIGTCMDPYGDCDGLVSNGCETDLRGVNNCGACDRACPVRPGATAACDATARACLTRCNGGFEDCNLNPLDGCEAAPATDVRHCGGCGRECRLANATSQCAGGRCAIAACAPGWGDCDGNATNGCEVNLESSTFHCGMCGRACPVRSGATPSCAAGACRSTCDPDRADCNGRADDGCETETRVDLLHCGGCALACRPANATGQCLSGVCEIAACDRGFLDCDGNPANGCETDLATSPRNCGACGRSCATGQVCLLGACVVDCGALTRCGSSCTDLRADDRNCGACGRACAPDEACAAGACTLVCRAPETLCAGRCVVTASNSAHCGACGRVCAGAPNATPVCTAGACGFACLPGFADCDGLAANGCEVSTVNDARNCGGCDVACAFPNAAATCSASRCVLGACNAGAGNCDGIASNGCEVTLASDARHCGRCGNACVSTCRDATCAPAVTVDRPTVINTTAAPVTGTRGTREVMIVTAAGLVVPVGARVVLHQTQGSAAVAGAYEFNTVTAAAGATLQLATPLRNDYTTAGTARAQLVVVQAYNDLVIGPTGELTAPEWNGRTGGILAVETTGVVLVEGAIRMNGRGFRGPFRGCTSSGGSNRCRYGQQGESWSGLGATGPTPNAGGGGGGGQGEDCGSGGGGAYGTGASAGTPGDCGRAGSVSGFCALQCPNEGGAAGGPYGVSSLAGTIHLGSSGGEGGMDEDGGLPGAGGNGGGVILLRADGAVTVRGAITASGADGLNGNQTACGGVGCGMGGGGGGAGGGVWIAAPSVSLGTSLVTATGGNGGQCSCRIFDVRRAAPAGRGGNGRVTVVAPIASGVTTPAYNPS